MPNEARRTYAIRASAFSASMLMASGIYLPFFPVWLDAHGLGPGQLSLVLAMPLIGRIFLSPFLIGLADRLPHLGIAAAVYSALAGALLIVPLLAPNFWTILVFAGAAMMFANTLGPFTEAVILYGVRQHGIDYGGVRLWGSVGFILANLGAAALVQRFSGDVVMPVLVAAYFWTALVALTAPHVPAPPVSDEPFGLRRALSDKVLRRVLVAGTLTLGAHGVFYTFATLTWQRVGFSDTLIGALWAFSVVVEISVFGSVKRILPGWGARRFLMAGAIAAIVRWSLFPFATHPAAAFALQTLHGATFGMSHLGITLAIGSVAVPGHTARLQAAYQFMTGLMMATAIIAGGPLFRLSPIVAFWAAAAATVPALYLACGLPRGLQPHRPGAGGPTVAPE